MSGLNIKKDITPEIVEDPCGNFEYNKIGKYGTIYSSVKNLDLSKFELVISSDVMTKTGKIAKIFIGYLQSFHFYKEMSELRVEPDFVPHIYEYLRESKPRRMFFDIDCDGDTGCPQTAEIFRRYKEGNQAEKDKIISNICAAFSEFYKEIFDVKTEEKTLSFFRTNNPNKISIHILFDLEEHSYDFQTCKKLFYYFLKKFKESDSEYVKFLIDSCDPAVYCKNQNFRLNKSSKYGKNLCKEIFKISKSDNRKLEEIAIKYAMFPDYKKVAVDYHPFFSSSSIFSELDENLKIELDKIEVKKSSIKSKVIRLESEKPKFPITKYLKFIESLGLEISCEQIADNGRYVYSLENTKGFECPCCNRVHEHKSPSFTFDEFRGTFTCFTPKEVGTGVMSLTFFNGYDENYHGKFKISPYDDYGWDDFVRDFPPGVITFVNKKEQDNYWDLVFAYRNRVMICVTKGSLNVNYFYIKRYVGGRIVWEIKNNKGLSTQDDLMSFKNSKYYEVYNPPVLQEEQKTEEGEKKKRGRPKKSQETTPGTLIEKYKWTLPGSSIPRPFKYYSECLDKLNICYSCDFIPYNRYYPDPCPEKVFNLFTGFRYVYKPTSEFTKEEVQNLGYILNHLENVICCGDKENFDYFLRWLTYPILVPSFRSDCCPIIFGPEGLGKSAIFEILKIAYGDKLWKTEGIQEITGNYNYDDCKSMFILEELTSEKNSHVKNANILKNRITADEVSVNKKFMNVERIKNFCNYAVLTNNEGSLYMDIKGKNRRFFVLHPSEKEEAYTKTENYFSNLIDKNKNENSVNNLISYVQELEFWDASKMRNVPHTKFRDEMAIFCMNDNETKLFSFFDRKTENGIIEGTNYFPEITTKKVQDETKILKIQNKIYLRCGSVMSIFGFEKKFSAPAIQSCLNRINPNLCSISCVDYYGTGKKIKCIVFNIDNCNSLNLRLQQQ